MSYEDIVNDPTMREFINGEKERQRFQEHIANLTDMCWDSCVDKPGQTMEGRTRTCIVNCVERFLDTTNYVVNRLDSIPSKTTSDIL